MRDEWGEGRRPRIKSERKRWAARTKLICAQVAAEPSLRERATEAILCAIEWSSVAEKVVIRLAKLPECPELEALQWRASLGNPGDREALLAHPDAIRLPPERVLSGDVFVAELNAAVVAFAGLRTGSDQEADLEDMFVEPKMQRRGIGKALLGYCIDVARQRGFCILKVVANPHALAFYLACGFSVVGQIQTQFGEAVLMRTEL